MNADTRHPLYPSPSREQLAAEAEAEDRAEAKRRYLRRFAPIFQDVTGAVQALNMLGSYDSAAKECANMLSDCLSDMRFTVESSA